MGILASDILSCQGCKPNPFLDFLQLAGLGGLVDRSLALPAGRDYPHLANQGMVYAVAVLLAVVRAFPALRVEALRFGFTAGVVGAPVAPVGQYDGLIFRQLDVAMPYTAKQIGM